MANDERMRCLAEAKWRMRFVGKANWRMINKGLHWPEANAAALPFAKRMAKGLADLNAEAK